MAETTAAAFLADNDVLDYDEVGREDSMSDSAARRLWEKVYRSVGATDEENKRKTRIVLYMWVCKNSTSTRADMRSEVTLLGHKVPIRNIFTEQVIPPSDMRRFFRAKKNVEELEQVARHPSSIAVLRERAIEKGVKPDYYVAAIDVSDLFKLSAPERAELERVKGAVLPNSAPVMPPVVSKAAAAGDSTSSAPAPSHFNLAGA